MIKDYEDWRPGEPNGEGVENCVELHTTPGKVTLFLKIIKVEYNFCASESKVKTLSCIKTITLRITLGCGMITTVVWIFVQYATIFQITIHGISQKWDLNFKAWVEHFSNGQKMVGVQLVGSNSLEIATSHQWRAIQPMTTRTTRHFKTRKPNVKNLTRLQTWLLSSISFIRHGWTPCFISIITEVGFTLELSVP